ncbi:hypothetical protein HK097_008749 [Rhizophlyctis rosea]|uniref:F-box domain-containing protein n=1 Tax=Rhizophlyctis rosea TaxID=64517 RepID=A0AAD5SBI1_9FUNG|nr:hypothetical protein HK097_008749 [Rhizophlyctis rosea]
MSLPSLPAEVLRHIALLLRPRTAQNFTHLSKAITQILSTHDLAIIIARDRFRRRGPSAFWNLNCKALETACLRTRTGTLLRDSTTFFMALTTQLIAWGASLSHYDCPVLTFAIATLNYDLAHFLIERGARGMNLIRTAVRNAAQLQMVPSTSK